MTVKVFAPVLPASTIRHGGTAERQVSHPNLRKVHPSRTFVSQRLLLGDRSQPGRDSPRLVLEDRTGRRQQYRYNFGGGSDGDVRAYFLNSSRRTCRRKRSYKVNALANELLPGRLRARARVDYFSDIVTNQTFNTNINDASSSQRASRGNVAGGWGTYSLNGTLDHSEYFYSQLSSSVSGSWPRFTVTRNERPVPNTPFYVSARGEYASILSELRSGPIEIDRGLTRLDFSPQIRVPFRKWQWFTANSTLSWRDTYYSRSLDLTAVDPSTGSSAIVEDNLNRQFFTFQTQLIGPVLNRIWDTPDNGYAERFKHSIEPYVTFTRTSVIDNRLRIVKLEGLDQIVGGTSQYTYGVANRFYAKRRTAIRGQPAQAREIFTVDLQQAYYSNQLAAQVDPQYSTSNSGAPPSHFSPISLTLRAQPTVDFNATARAEFDSRYRELRTMSVTGTYSWSSQLQSTFGWSKRAFIAELDGFNNPNSLDHSLNASATLRTRDNKYEASTRSTTTCCDRGCSSNGSPASTTRSAARRTRVPEGQLSSVSDRRFFMSFTLAGSATSRRSTAP